MGSDEVNKNTKRSSRFKWILGTIVMVFLLVFISFLLLLDSIIKKQITKEVQEASDGQYSLEIKDLDARFWSGAIRMDSVWLKPNKDYVHKHGDADVPDINFYLDSVSISEIQWVAYLLNQKKLLIGDVLIANPHLIVKSEFGEKASVKESNRNFLDYLPGIVAAFTGSLQIESIHVINGKANVDLYGKKYSVFQKVEDVHLYLDEIRIDTTSEQRALFSKKADLSLKDYKLTTTDGSAHVSIKKIAGNIHDSTLHFDKIHFFYKNDSMLNKLHVNMKELSTGGVDFTNLFRSKKIAFRLMNFNEPDVVFESTEVVRSEPTNKSDTTSLLNEIAPFIAESFDVDTLSINNGKFFHRFKQQKNTITQSAKDISLYFTRVKVDSIIANEKLFVENIDIKVKDYCFHNSEGVDLKVENLKASVADSLLYLGGIHFDSRKKDSIRVNAQSLIGHGINYLDIVNSKYTRLSNLEINNPKVYIDATKVGGGKASGGNSLDKIIQPFSEFKIYSNLIIINNGEFFQSIKTGKTRISHGASEIYVKVNSLNLDKESIDKKDVIDKFTIKFKRYALNFQKENFFIHARNGKIDSEKRSLLLDSVSLSQLRSFGPYQRNFFRSEMESVKIENVDLKRILESNEMNSSKLVIDKMDLFISLDELQKDTIPDKRVTPQSIIKKIPFPVKIDSVVIARSSLAYEDITTRNISGKLTLKDMDVSIKNFSNDSSRVSQNSPLQLYGKAYMLGEALFEVQLILPDLNNDLNAMVSGSLHPVEGEVFNEMLALGGIQVRSGQLNGCKFKFKIQRDQACGELLFKYDNLKIDIIDTSNFKTRNIKGRLANFMIQDSNPSEPGEEPDKAPLEGKFEEDGNFMGFVWDVLRDGIISSVTKNRLFEKFVKR